MIPNHSEAAVIEQFGTDLNIRDIHLTNNLQKNQIIVKMDVSGLCHTDLHIIEGDWEGVKATLPKVPGHEGIGWVIAKGCDVNHVDIGDKVCIPWLHSTCLECEMCESGWEALCAKQERTGFSLNGTFSKYAVAVGDFVGKIPPNLTSEQAAPIACAGVTVYKALKVAKLKENNYVAIVGAGGGLGHLAIQYANYMKYKTIGIDVGKNEFLQSVGCMKCIDVRNEDTTNAIMEYTTEGVHAAICLAPNKRSMEEAVKYVRPGGYIILVGLTPEKVEFDVVQIILKGLHIIGSIVGNRQDLQEAIDIAAESGTIRCEIEIKPFEQINDCVQRLKSGNTEGRLVLKF